MKKDISYNDYSCELCETYKITSFRSLGNHLAHSHKQVTTQKYITQFFYKNLIPLCACGCGQETRWHVTKYIYNTFINGHNDCGFKAKNWKPTQQQIEKRNDAIKQAYKERKEEITSKISIAVNKALENPEMHKNLSNAQKAAWAKPGAKEKGSAVRKKTWSEQHVELCEKIFTPEMRHKISVSNMNHDTDKHSMNASAFFEHIKQYIQCNLYEVYFLNESKLIFDAYIPEHKLLIEFDGTFWHGLDRDTNFTQTQLISMANDFRKAKWALDNHISLIRIREDNNEWQSATTIEDLISCAHHHQNERGEIIKDGLFKFRDEEHAIIDKETIIRTNEPQFSGLSREYTENELMPAIFEFFRAYVSLRGWFYPDSSKESLLSVVQKIKRCEYDADSDFISGLNPTGNSYLKTQFKSYWNVIKGPAKRFWDDKALNSVLRYRLGLNTSIPYHYTLSDGTEIDCHETFDINIKNIRFGFVVQRNAVSFFRPTTAFEIYKRFIPEDCKAPTVWDPSIGFGGRLLGFAASFPNGNYIGTDPSTELFEDLKVFSKKIQKDFSNLQIDLNMCGSEEIELEENSLELVMSSPPYFQKEFYTNEETQCHIKYQNYNDWFDYYLVPTFKNAYKALKNNCLMIINIDNENKKAVLNAAEFCKFKFVKEYKMQVARDHFNKKAGHNDKQAEPILVFQK